MTVGSMSFPSLGSPEGFGLMPVVMGLRAALGKISAAIGENTALLSDNAL
jgi:hypothetical protein